MVVISHLLSKCSEVAATSFSLFYNMIFFVASKRSRNEDIITLQILAELSCLQIFIQDQTRNISEIKIEGNKISKKKVNSELLNERQTFTVSFIPLGLDSEVIMRPSVTEINAKLRNIIVLDSDVTAIYKKV